MNVGWLIIKGVSRGRQVGVEEENIPDWELREVPWNLSYDQTNFVCNSGRRRATQNGTARATVRKTSKGKGLSRASVGK